MAEEGQEHPISTYLWVWLLLFVLSAFSYAVDYVGFQGFTRWTLVLLFMFLKEYFITFNKSFRIIYYCSWSSVSSYSFTC